MSTRRIHIYPVPGVSLYPWRAVPQEVTAAEWAALQKYSPPPFTDKRPGSVPEPEPTDPPDSGSSVSGGTD